MEASETLLLAVFRNLPLPKPERGVPRKGPENLYHLGQRVEKLILIQFSLWK